MSHDLAIIDALFGVHSSSVRSMLFDCIQGICVTVVLGTGLSDNPTGSKIRLDVHHYLLDYAVVAFPLFLGVL